MEMLERAKEKEWNKSIDVSVYEAITHKSVLSINESAAYLGISERTLFRLMKSGRVQTHKLGARTLIRKKHLKNLLG